MKTTVKENKIEKKEEVVLTDAFALWLHKSKAGNEYLSGTCDENIGNTRLVGYFNTMKKNPKEPDIRIYTLDGEGHQDKEIADLWENEGKNKVRYLTGTTDEKEKLVGFYGDKEEEKRPYIRVYFN